MKIPVLIICTLFIVSCTSNSDYEKLKADYSKLEKELDSIKIENKALLEYYNAKRTEEIQLEERRINEERYSDNDVKNCINDWYGFYNADKEYRNVRIRKSEPSKFIISLEERIKGSKFPGVNIVWNSKILILTINENGTYRIQYN